MKAALVTRITGGFTRLGAGAAPPRVAPTLSSHPWGQPDCPCSEVLHVGTPAMGGSAPRALDMTDGAMAHALVRWVFPGAMVPVVRRGVMATCDAYGYALTYYTHSDYTADPHPLPMPASDVRVSSIAPMEKGESFDPASVTKLLTAVAVTQLWDQGEIKLDDRVAKYLPSFGVNGKEPATIRELTTHTSGFESYLQTPLYDIKGAREQRLWYVMGLLLEYPPNTHYVCGNIGFVLRVLIKKVGGGREGAFIREHITRLLHLKSTTHNPPSDLRSRVAASEYQPWLRRGMLRRQVQDSSAWVLDGAAGHDGLFSGAHDLAVFGQMMLSHRTYDATRILSARATRLMPTSSVDNFPNVSLPGLRHGFGWRLDMPMFVGALADLLTVSYEGHTGAMVVINPESDLVAALLTNRVHPTRKGPSAAPTFREVYTQVANAIPVVPSGPSTTWFARHGDYLNRTLTVAAVPHGGQELTFGIWYCIQPNADYGIAESTVAGTRWADLHIFTTGSSAGWPPQRMHLPAHARYVRLRYQTDASINGRRWYLHNIDAPATGVGAQTIKRAKRSGTRSELAMWSGSRAHIDWMSPKRRFRSASCRPWLREQQQNHFDGTHNV